MVFYFLSFFRPVLLLNACYDPLHLSFSKPVEFIGSLASGGVHVGVLRVALSEVLLWGRLVQLHNDVLAFLHNLGLGLGEGRRRRSSINRVLK